MRQLNQLREFMLQSVAELQQHPDKLQIWTDDGELVFKTLDPLPNHRNEYTASVLITDYAGGLESLAMPLMTFIKKYNSQGNDDSIAYEAEIIDHDRADVLFKVKLIDNVNTSVTPDDDIVIDPVCEPTVPWFFDPPGEYVLIVDGKEVARWQA